jgi:hypothetical protein
MNTDPAPYVLGSEEGEAFWFFGGLVTQPIPASAGSFVHAPARVAHAFQVDSGTARNLNGTTARHGEDHGRGARVRGGDTRPTAGRPYLEPA